MATEPTVYLDVCCLHRPFDDQSQDRIRFESEAVKLILDLQFAGKIRWVSSEVVHDEVLQNPDEDKRSAVLAQLRDADEYRLLDEQAINLARTFIAQGIRPMDALHLALAETSGCDIILTTDDGFLGKASRLKLPLRVRIENPARWITEVVWR